MRQLPLRPPAARLGAAGAALLLAACASTPPDQDPVQIRLNDLDARLGKIERVVNNQSLVALAQRVDTLEADARTLRGEVEELQNANESLRKQQRDLYADLDKRLAAVENGTRAARAAAAGAPQLSVEVPGSVTSPGGGADASAGSMSAGTEASAGSAGAASPSPASALSVAVASAASTAGAGVGASPAEQSAYSQAFDLLKASNYPAAVTAFKGFLASYPLSELASNAQYWLGETYYVTRDFASALDAFQRVVRDWPASRKAPDALVKLGFTQAELKRYPAARSTLNLVLSQYPGTDAAKLAADRLTKLPTS
jgi:tol-pal system protein YbgF